MNAAPQVNHAPEDRRSRTQVKKPDGMLTLVENIRHIDTKILDEVRAFIFEKRREIEKLIANDQGQLSMFPGLVDGEIRIPEEDADEIIEAVNERFASNLVQLKREGDKIMLVQAHEKKDAYGDLGYHRG